MKFINTKHTNEGGIRRDFVAGLTEKLQKYTYILPSGRKLKVVVDGESQPLLEVLSNLGILTESEAQWSQDRQDQS